ncbi:MAG TPA: DNA methyltransferase [Chitinophagaceae bacterium]|nr:DNA methyltransferase [Chitinophagaceae bacterium]
MNHLYFGDCLDVLQELHQNYPQPFIDLIYIDPPFNSKRNYNVLFESIGMQDANAQKQAFADTWSNVSYMDEMHMLADLDKDLYDVLQVFDKTKSISNGAVAYLTTMAHRLWYMHKLLKDTGSFYLHCDPTMSHYLKLLCDMLFGEDNFRNEIIWQRTSARSDSKKWNHIHDTILLYTKSDKYTWNKQYIAYDEAYTEKFYRFVEPETGRRYASDNLTAAGTREGSSGNTWRGINVKGKGLHWKYTTEKLDVLDKEGRIIWPQKEGGVPRFKRYLDEMKGLAIQSIVDDIPPLSASSAEKLGYPTQKPEALLERIVSASSNEGDVVADFFCGCGTSISVAQRLNRKWLGADISHLAVRLILKRLIDTYGEGVKDNVKLHGFPKDVASAKMLAQDTENGRFGFQEWVIEVLLHGVVNIKKVADGGFDGYLTYQTDKAKEFVLIETKSGGVNVKNIREFVQVIDKQKAAAGIFVCFADTVTKEMLKEAKAAGHIKLGTMDTGLDKIQIITVDDLLNGKQPNLPNISSTFKKAQKKETKGSSYGLFD